MTLSQLRYFSTLAKVQNFTKASVKLYISQPALSKAISDLESELDVRLFDRDSRQVRLTIYGERFLKYIDKALEEVDKGQKELDRLRKTAQNEVTIGCTYSMLSVIVRELLKDFAPDHKEIRVHYKPEKTNRAVMEDLLKSETDIAFVYEEDPRVNETVVWRQHIFAEMLQSHRLASKAVVTPHDLQSENIIVPSEEASLRRFTDEFFKDCTEDISICYVSDNYIERSLALEFGENAVLLTPKLPDLKPNFMFKPLADCKHYREVYMASCKDKQASQAEKTVWNYIMSKRPLIVAMQQK